jgi:transcriptional regulator with XRE-family HTH domain
VSAVSQIENGRRSPNVSTLDKLAEAFGVEVADFFPKARSSSLEPPLFDGLEDERRAEATGRSEEERIGISSALSGAIGQMSVGYRGALEELSGAPVDEIFALYMQASLSYVGARTIAEDAGYSTDALDDSPPERVAKEQMRDALAKLEETADEIERVMEAAEAEQELPDGVTLLAKYERRHAV